MASTYLTYTQQSPSTVEGQKFTLSMWVKKCVNGQFQGLWGNTYSNTHRGYIYFTNSDYLTFYDSNGILVQTNRTFRDTNAFYHIVISADTTQGTASDRVKFYINGVQETSFSTANYPNQNDGMKLMNTTLTPNMGRYVEQGTSYYLRGVISHAHLTQGYTYDATPFGETDSTTGEWKIKTSVTGVTYGTNGFFILKDGNSLTDQSGNSNNFTVGGGTLTKTEDCPSNIFATCNPLATSSYSSLTQGNNTVKGNTNTNDGETYSTLGTGNKGKWYWEIKATGLNGTGNPKLGFVQSNRTSVMRLQNGGSGYGGAENNSLDIMTRPDGKVTENGSTSSVLYGTFSAGDIISFALDSDNGAFYYAINGTWQNSGNPASGSSRTGAIKTWNGSDAKALGGQHVCIGSYENSTQADCNFGNGFFGTTAISSAGSNGNGSLFEYDVPSGYYALNTKNINTYG